MACNCGSGNSTNSAAAQLSPPPSLAGGSTPDGTPTGKDGSRGGTVPYYSSPGGAGARSSGGNAGGPYTASGSGHASPNYVPTSTGSGPPNLGDLSAKFESSGNVGAFNRDPNPKAGFDYGKYQIATGTGTMNNYLSFMQTNNPTQFEALKAQLPPGTDLAQMQQLANSGDSKFVTAWQATATTDAAGLGQSQQDFIKSTHFDKSVQKINNETGLDVSQRSLGVQNVVWAMSVQMGPNSDAFKNAFVGKNVGQMSDPEIIHALEDQHGNVGRYFPSSSDAVQQSIVTRVEKERQGALQQVNNPTPMKVPTVSNTQIGV